MNQRSIEAYNSLPSDQKRLKTPYDKYAVLFFTVDEFEAEQERQANQTSEEKQMDALLEMFGKSNW